MMVKEDAFVLVRGQKMPVWNRTFVILRSIILKYYGVPKVLRNHQYIYIYIEHFQSRYRAINTDVPADLSNVYSKRYRSMQLDYFFPIT